MQNAFRETQLLYRNFIDSTEKYITETNDEITSGNINNFLKIIQSARRIFFTGTGSSIPSALFGSFYCSEKMNLSAQYVPTGYILSTKFQKDDLIVLCTQGFNRGDSILITKKILKEGAQLAIFTSNKESKDVEKANCVFYFSPFPEKLFCRPVGVITGIEALAKVLMPDFSINQSLEAYKTGAALRPLLFEEQYKYVVLSSGWGNPIGFNFALALREGCGLDAVFYDIETYAHGLYVSDQIWKSKGNSLKYLIIDTEDSTHSRQAVERIMPFIKSTQSEHEIFSSKYKLPYAYFELLARLSNSVYSSNEKNMYDMNHPPSKENNRYYHNEDTYTI